MEEGSSTGRDNRAALRVQRKTRGRQRAESDAGEHVSHPSRGATLTPTAGATPTARERFIAAAAVNVTVLVLGVDDVDGVLQMFALPRKARTLGTWRHASPQNETGWGMRVPPRWSAIMRPTIALISCGVKHLRELGAALLALTTHASGADIFLFADEHGRQAVQSCLEHFNRVCSISVLPIAEQLQLEADDGRFACASGKLLLQAAPALAGRQFILVMDVDTIALEDINALWVPWTTEMHRTGSLWAMVAEAAPSDFARHAVPSAILNAPMAMGADRTRYFNTGVMLIHARELERRHLMHDTISMLVAEASQTVEARPSSAQQPGRNLSRFSDYGPFTEQTLLSAWLSSHPRLVTPLPCARARLLALLCECARLRPLAAPSLLEVPLASLKCP